jgi:hypothetical protein
MGNAPFGSPSIDPGIGAPQADTFHHYKMARLEFTAMDRATRQEEQQAKRQKRTISPDNIQRIAEQRMARIPWKSNGCRYHSFVEEHSSLQDYYPEGQPRRFYRLTGAGMAAPESDWADPYAALYGR